MSQTKDLDILNDEKLATLGMLDQLGHRNFIIPMEVKGFFQRTRKIVYSFLALIFLILPWTTWNGVQTIWLDVPARRFVLFGQIFWAHDVPFIFFVFILIFLSLVIMAIIFGRAWCGWMCPQTVFIDLIYRQIEIWTEGTALARRKLQTADWSINKLFRKSLKWVLFIVASSVIAHSVLAFFIGKNDLLSMTQGTPAANLTYFLLVLFFTSLFAFNFGWFREQFCVIMCPYGRLQALMVDENSRTVQYQASRGEPRRGIDTGSGDCIDCRMCVHACPTGIDIRRGIQLECIACTACIDACNTIMAKVNKPPNLITYGSEDQLPLKLFRPRLIIAMGLWIVLFSTFVFFLWKKSDFFIELIRQKGQPYIVLPSGDIQNQFYLRTINGSTKPHSLKIEIDDPARFELIYPKQDRMIYPQQDLKIPIFVRLKKSEMTKWTQPKISLHFDDHIIVRQIHFIQPEGDQK